MISYSHISGMLQSIDEKWHVRLLYIIAIIPHIVFRFGAVFVIISFVSWFIWIILALSYQKKQGSEHDLGRKPIIASGTIIYFPLSYALFIVSFAVVPGHGFNLPRITRFETLIRGILPAVMTISLLLCMRKSAKVKGLYNFFLGIFPIVSAISIVYTSFIYYGFYCILTIIIPGTRCFN